MMRGLHSGVAASTAPSSARSSVAPAIGLAAPPRAGPAPRVAAIGCALRTGGAHGRQRQVASATPSGRDGKGSGGTDEDAEWEAEMTIFNQRISRPNQLATLRELEAKVSLGKVLFARDGLAIVSGLNADAPLGTKVSFLTGTSGVLLWHRSDNLSFCIVLGDPSTVCEGTPVECKIKGVLQVVDDVKGPITRKDFELFHVPAGEELFGRVLDHIGRHRPEYDDAHAPAPAPDSAAAATAPSSSSSSATSGAAVAVAPAGSAARSGGGGGGGGGGAARDRRPLINQQVEMKEREQIAESLLTGVKGLDILTPLGRGASLLVIGPGGSGKTRLALDALLGQARAAAAAAAVAGAGGGGGPLGGAPPGGAVRNVLALVGRPKAEVQAVVSELRARGALSNTVVVVAEEGAPLGHQYAALCCACSIGERVRDDGGHSLVVVDDIKPLADVWEQLLGGLVGLGAALLREGLVKDESGRDLPVVAPPGTMAADGPAASPLAPPAAAAAAAAPGGDGTAAGGGRVYDDDNTLVEYEGMLVSGAVAQRRGFLSTFFMRSAKMSRTNGGGSMTLLPLVPGTCATGVSRRIDMSKYKTLSPEQLIKLEAALRAKQLAEELASGGGGGELATEVVEEFISIADGQLVLERPAVGQQPQQQAAASASSSFTPAYTVNPRLSVTRIGTRAYYPALEVLAPQVRLGLSQADDARRFNASASASSAPASTSSAASGSSVDLPGGGGGGGGGSGGGGAGAEARADALARRLSAALLQEAGQPAGLAEQVVSLYAVQRGFADAVAPEQLPAWLRAALAHVAERAPSALQAVGGSGTFPPAAEAGIAEALRSFKWRP